MSRSASFSITAVTLTVLVLATSSLTSTAQQPGATTSPNPAPSGQPTPAATPPAPAPPAAKSPLTGNDMTAGESAAYGNLQKSYHDLMQAKVDLETIKACGGTTQEIANAEKALASAQKAFDAQLQDYVYMFNEPGGATGTTTDARRKLNEQTLGTPGQRTKDEQKQYDNTASQVTARLAKDNKTYTVPACPANPGTTAPPTPTPPSSTTPAPATPTGGTQGQAPSQPSPQASPQPSIPASNPGISQPNSDYGSGGHAVVQNNTTGAVLTGVVYDTNNNLRHDETNTYTTTGSGPELKTEQHGYNYDIGGHLQLGWDLKYDLRGGLSYTDVTHYGLHGERTAEEITTYKPTGYEIKDWSIGRHQWYSDDITYKTPLPTGTTATTLAPTNTDLGVLFPHSYLPGETVTGSLWPKSYAEDFKTVPGLSEYSFSVPLYHLPDASPEWSSLRIGVKGDGYVPINPNGTFSVHIPLDWKGPLQLQVRLDTPMTGTAPSNALLNIDPPVAAPTLPDSMFSQVAHLRLHDDEEDYLVSLWEDASDIEERLDYLYGQANPDWERIFDLEEDLDWYYNEIDYIEDDLPPSEVIKLAQEMLQEAQSFHAWLGGKSNLTEDDKDDLDDCESWIDFLKDEIGYNKFAAIWGPGGLEIQPYSTNPVLTRGHLAELGGTFSLDPYDTHVHIDNFNITPLVATPRSWIFMPPTGLTAGQHDYLIDSSLFPETIFPVFNMTMDESIVTNKMLTGQSTSYRFTLNGMNGVPGGAWGGSYYPTDLVGSSELSAAQQAAGNSHTGFITFSVTNETPDVISMQNVFKILDASSFVPNGSDTIEGGIGALKKGNFLINGEARAYLNPMIGIGVPPGTTVPSGLYNPMSTPLSYNWLPSFSVNYDQAAFSNSSFMTNNCSGSAPAATTPTGGTAAPTPCVESVINDLMPVKSVLDNNVQGNAPTTVPVGDTAKTPDVDAAKKRVEEAHKRTDAAGLEAMKAWNREGAAFNGALKKLSDDDQNDYRKALNRAVDTFTKWTKAQDDYKKDPSPENKRQAGLLKEQVNIDGDLESAARDAAIEKFKPEDRQAWQAAHDAAKKAEQESINALDEQRAAEENLQKLQAATAN